MRSKKQQKTNNSNKTTTTNQPTNQRNKQKPNNYTHTKRDVKHRSINLQEEVRMLEV